MLYILMALFTAGAVVADQLVKLWVVKNIPLYTVKPAIPGIFHLTYTQNTGAAFSSFEGMRWLFIAVFAVFTGLVIWDFIAKKMPFSKFERWCICAVFAGGLGNIIDRVRLGFVVDMIEVDFMKFPVFNVADCFICCGCAALMVSLVFFNKEFWKDGKK